MSPMPVPIGSVKRRTGFRTRSAKPSDVLVKQALSSKKINIPLIRKAVSELEHEIHRQKPHLSKVVVHGMASNKVIDMLNAHLKKKK